MAICILSQNGHFFSNISRNVGPCPKRRTRVVDDKWMALKADGSVSDSACFASGWYDDLLQKVPLSFTKTNMFVNAFMYTSFKHTNDTY
jgi:hypothetical protein